MDGSCVSVLRASCLVFRVDLGESPPPTNLNSPLWRWGWGHRPRPWICPSWWTFSVLSPGSPWFLTKGRRRIIHTHTEQERLSAGSHVRLKRWRITEEKCETKTVIDRSHQLLSLFSNFFLCFCQHVRSWCVYAQTHSLVASQRP